MIFSEAIRKWEIIDKNILITNVLLENMQIDTFSSCTISSSSRKYSTRGRLRGACTSCTSTASLLLSTSMVY